MKRPKLSKFIGCAVGAAISMLLGDYVSGHFFHLPVSYDPIALSFRYTASYLTMWIVKSFLDKVQDSFKNNIKNTNNIQEQVNHYHHEEIKESLPVVHTHYYEFNSLISQFNLKNDASFVQLNEVIENIFEQYQSIIDRYDIKDIKSEYTEHYLFLKTEVDKLLISITEETKQILKLEKYQSTQFEQFREQFVNLMLERANMVQEKLHHINESLFTVKSQQMLLEAKTNHAVLKSKM